MTGTVFFLLSRTAMAAASMEMNEARPADGPLTTGSLIQVTVGLLVVVLTIFGLAWFVRRYGRFQSSANGALKVVGGLSVGPRERVVLLQIKDRQLLVGVAPGRVQMLHELEGRVTPAEVEAPGAARPAKPLFATLLKRERP
ncbi:MAG TPA: flagellar biosynthetic protein FliO [Gammaproteobacteria bacterium]|nr:flagellar biosynthetic protein FliO [Gammaproteobacteria bacterium]